MRTVDDYAKLRTAHRDGMTIRQIARTFHVSRRTVRDALASPEPTPYTRTKPPPAPVLGPFTAIIDQVLRDDRDAPAKQRHTAAQLFRRGERVLQFASTRKDDQFEFADLLFRNVTAAQHAFTTQIYIDVV